MMLLAQNPHFGPLRSKSGSLLALRKQPLRNLGNEHLLNRWAMQLAGMPGFPESALPIGLLSPTLQAIFAYTS